MVVAAGFALILTVEVAMPILQVNKLRPNEVEELIRRGGAWFGSWVGVTLTAGISMAFGQWQPMERKRGGTHLSVNQAVSSRVTSLSASWELLLSLQMVPKTSK